MKRKILALLLVAATAVACLAFTACGDPAPSETYTGTVSEQSYTSSEEAANAFISNEIASSTDVAVYSGSNKEKDLTEEEVEVLNVPEESGKTIDHVEKWKVAYTKSAVQTYAASASAENNYVTVYIIVYKVSDSGISVVDAFEYKYYVPLPENGEALSYSYYASVFNPENYANCTVTYISDTTLSLSAQGQHASETQRLTYTMHITESAVVMDINIAGQTGSYYIVKTANGGAKGVLYMFGEYQTADLSDMGIYEYDEIFSSQLSEAECSFFVKTDYGFKMNESKLTNLMDDVLNNINVSGIRFNFSGTTAKAEYYVVEGKLYKQTTEVNSSLSVSIQGQYATGSVKVKAECKYTNFGTTTVTLPDQVKDLLGV